MPSSSQPVSGSAPDGGSARQRSGYAAEQRALDYLTARGLRPIARNFRVRMGEIDLVMVDGVELVFVEVRQRSGAGFGGAAASVTGIKQQRVRRAAQAFLARHCAGRRWPAVRFDVVAIDDGRIDWIRAAF